MALLPGAGIAAPGPVKEDEIPFPALILFWCGASGTKKTGRVPILRVL